MNEANVPTISELSAQNDALRAEVETLQAKNGALRNDLDAALSEQCGRFTVVVGDSFGKGHGAVARASFDTLAKAITAYDSVIGHMWRYIEYNGRRLTVSDTKP